MATLVLTVVGGVVGGPIGAAIGAFVGQEIDRNLLFRPKGREGPRLTELKVQTSSYGSAIPKVFGTMRVAGSVIWSTDLIEARSTAHHKNQPSVTTYSYSASFAVLLSARPVVGVGRIWADGNLLRGSAGDFKAQTGFRLHTGGEDQAADPLIASLEGGLAPAHRGCAYAVFEHLQLADFGNRIPSLSFELIADPVAVGAGAIAAEVSGGAIVDAGVVMTIDGFSAYGADARETVKLLALASGARFAAVGGALSMTGATDSSEVGDLGFSADRERHMGRRQIAAIETVPRTLTIAYYDAARDYQAGVQQARRPGSGTRAEQLDMPAVMSAATAKTLVEASLLQAEASRERRRVSLTAGAAAIAPGSVVTIAGERGRWRVVEAALEAMVTELTLIRIAPDAPAASATTGRVSPAPDLIGGTTILQAAELPMPEESVLVAPRLSVFAAGTGEGWRRAALLYSLDDGASWRDGGLTAAPAVLGTIVVPPGAAPATLADTSGSIEVELARSDMMLVNADDAMLDGGANLALAGDELLQFGRAESLGGSRWRLSLLWRGRRGTEAATGTQLAGDRFVMIAADGVAAIDLPVAALGSTVRLLASGVGDNDAPVEVSVPIDGASIRPPTPVELHLATNESEDPELHWTRRSRLGFRWIDGSDAPLVEENERYRVEITPPAGDSRSVIANTPVCLLLPAETGSGTAIEVRQLGTLGESAPARLILP